MKNAITHEETVQRLKRQNRQDRQKLVARLEELARYEEQRGCDALARQHRKSIEDLPE